ncbi:MAG: sulfatase [Anaerolineae bacterium]
MSDKPSKEISRRHFLKGTAILGGSLIAGGFGYRAYYNHTGRDFRPGRASAYLNTVEPIANPQALPNIVIVLVDDLGYGDLDSDNIDTPNLDRMAAEGVRLNNFYASASLCSPSRAGLLTGRYPVRTLVTNPVYPSGDPMNLLMDGLGRYSYGVRDIPEDEVLLPEALSRKGYHTGMVGKWHLGDRPGHLPNDRGFDSFYGVLYSNDVSPYAIYRDREIAVEAPADQNLLTHDFTLEAQAFIRSHRDEPFFLYLAHPMPHEPIHASESFRGQSRAGLYGDAVEELDWSIGQILETLRKLEIDESTLVIFTSDNGPWWQGNPGFTRGRKMLTFDGGFRMPFLARWPGVIPAGTVSKEMSMNFDLFSTCLQLAGIDLPDDRIIDGKDIMPLLVGDSSSPHDSLYFYDTRALVAVRHENYKYHRRFRTENAGYFPLKQGPFLFDLETDPNESYSLIESRPEMAAELASMLDTWDARMDANLRGWIP